MHVLEQVPTSSFQIMDAYWMTLARPDNRELSEKGKRAKLAHPGTEVMSAIVGTLSDHGDFKFGLFCIGSMCNRKQYSIKTYRVLLMFETLCLVNREEIVRALLQRDVTFCSE
jgi:hypothetical protein